jgi:Protein of unknown function (DUF2971)
MLHSRLSKLGSNNIIYHYCSIEAAISILTNKTIRFSDINMMNDAEESQWGYSIFEQAASQILKRDGLTDDFKKLIEGLDLEFIDVIDRVWSPMGQKILQFISCFSTDGDSLSQWRAYADDGRGVAVGFRVGELRQLPIQMLDVEYIYENQLLEMRAAIAATFNIYKVSKDIDNLFDLCALLAASAIGFKNPAWGDEKEVRCQHALSLNIDDNCWRVLDEGGTSYGRKTKGQTVKFINRNGSIVACVDIPFLVNEKQKPIAEIVLGPKFPNAEGNLKLLLGNNGYSGVEIKNAGSAYR